MKMMSASRMGKSIFWWMLIFAAGILSGILLLAAAFLIPTENMNENLKVTDQAYSTESAYPVVNYNASMILDNYTDALMQESAAFDMEGASVWEKTMAVYRPGGGDTPVEALHDYVNGNECPVESYARYWHGYLIFLKPLLAVMDYLEIRSVNSVCQYILIAAAAALLFIRCSLWGAAAFVIGVLFLRLEAVTCSLQYSTVFYVTLTGLIVYLAWNRQLKTKLPYCFLILGMAVNYFDLLTYPVASLGFFLSTWLLTERQHGCLWKWKRVLGYSLCWAAGYGGMWTSKWLAGSLILKQNVLGNAIGAAAFRISREVSGEKITWMDVIKKNMRFGFGVDKTGVMLLGLSIALCILALVKCRKKWKEYFLGAIPFLTVALMPYLWYMVLCNHSFIHAFFTYRVQAVSVYALAALGAFYLSADRE